MDHLPNATVSPELRERVESAIARTLRPMIAADGGDIELVRVNEGTVVVRLVGSCSGCPGRPYTMARLIEPVLRQLLGPAADISLEVG